ncbi:MAG TPA: glycosyltransferase family 4 protein [Candidatus Paceibacterota bacterium]|nr:glycosyltransferase family 4 protein [Candidatus Paceibacterota bacterium]
MKKILFVTNDFGPRAGGIESFIMGIIENLPKDSVLVYTSRQSDTSEYDRSWYADYGVEVLRDRTKVLLPTPRVSRTLQKIVNRAGVDVVCFGAAAPLGLLANGLRRRGVSRIVAITHGHEVWWAKVFPFSLALRRIGDCVDVLTYLGEFTKREISKALSDSARSSMVRLAPGIDIEHFSPSTGESSLRSELNLEGKKVVISVGRLVKRKGQDRLIEALPSIRKAIPNAHLLFVGEGSYGRHLRKLVHREGISDAVTFVGRVPFTDLPKYFRVGDVFAMPSRSRFGGLEVEGLGIVYLEASSCGLPVIAGRSGGAPDAVVEGETGLIVDGKNVEEIARVISSLLSDEAKAKEMGKYGREWVLAQWSWKSWSNRFAEILKSR